MKNKLQFHNADQQLVPYDGQPLSWRVSAYVLIVKDEQLLIIKNKTEIPYDIPGGGIEFGETIAEALQREAMEEAGATITINDLIHHQMDFFYHRSLDQYFQTLQLFYKADLKGELVTPTEPNISLVKFIPLTELEKYPLPKAVIEAIILL